MFTHYCDCLDRASSVSSNTSSCLSIDDGELSMLPGCDVVVAASQQCGGAHKCVTLTLAKCGVSEENMAKVGKLFTSADFLSGRMLRNLPGGNAPSMEIRNACVRRGITNPINLSGGAAGEPTLLHGEAFDIVLRTKYNCAWRAFCAHYKNKATDIYLRTKDALPSAGFGQALNSVGKHAKNQIEGTRIGRVEDGVIQMAHEIYSNNVGGLTGQMTEGSFGLAQSTHRAQSMDMDALIIVYTLKDFIVQCCGLLQSMAGAVITDISGSTEKFTELIGRSGENINRIYSQLKSHAWGVDAVSQLSETLNQIIKKGGNDANYLLSGLYVSHPARSGGESRTIFVHWNTDSNGGNWQVLKDSEITDFVRSEDSGSKATLEQSPKGKMLEELYEELANSDRCDDIGRASEQMGLKKTKNSDWVLQMSKFVCTFTKIGQGSDQQLTDGQVEEKLIAKVDKASKGPILEKNRQILNDTIKTLSMIEKRGILAKKCLDCLASSADEHEP